jgi:predicted nucleic acid-binding protein
LTLLIKTVKMSNSKVLILVDADVIIHLFKADKISLLNELYSGRVRIMDIVLSELLANLTINKVVENLFRFKQIEEIKFPQNLYLEFYKIKDTVKGKGERATLIYCKHTNNIIASSNTKDIVPYCKENSMSFLTTLDIFTIAIERELMTESEANLCIGKITMNNESYVCCKTIEEHKRLHFNTEKFLY